MRRLGLFLLTVALILPVMAWGPAVTPAHADAGTMWTAEYFTNRYLVGQAYYVRLDESINFDWGGNSPVPGLIPQDNFSVRWSGPQYFEAGTHVFSATVDDGVRVYVDDRLVIDAWFDQLKSTHTGEATLTAGQHWVRVEYYDGGDQAYAQFSWRPKSALVPPGGWAAEYYNNPNVTAPQVGGRLEPVLDHNWGIGSPIPGTVNADNFSARWMAFPNFEGGTYTFYAGADDGIRVWVDNTIVVDAWWASAYKINQGTASISPGQHTVKVEYFDIGANARVEVYWVRVGSASVSGVVTGATLSATINTGALNVRTGPGVTYDAVGRAYQGEAFTAIARSDNGWYQISGPAFSGWVSGRYVLLSGDANALPLLGAQGAAAPANRQVQIQSNASLRIRRGPGTNYTRISALERAEIATVIGRTADSSWLKIRTADGTEGWVSAAFVTVLNNASLNGVAVTG